MMKRVILIVLVSCATAVWAADADLFFIVSNGTGFTIASLYVTKTESEEWGKDYLGDNPLLDGESVQIPLTDLESVIVKVRARDDEGDTYTLRSIDAGKEDVAITLGDIDPD